MEKGIRRGRMPGHRAGPCVETADIIPGRGLPVKRAAPGKGEDGIWE